MGTTQSSSTGKTIRLQSALATIASETKNQQGRVLFDTGSQRSFVTKGITNALMLKPIRKEVLELTTFACKESKRNKYDVVSLKLLTENEDITIEALVTPTIYPPIKAKLSHNCTDCTDLLDLELADRPGNDDSKNVDVIIGNDCYGNLVTGEMTK